MSNHRNPPVNFYILTENQSLFTGLKRMIENICSRQDNCLYFNIHLLTEPAKLIIAILRNGGSSAVIFDTENYFFYELMLTIEKMQDSQVPFKSLLLCSRQEKMQFRGFYKTIFDVSLDKKSKTYHIEAALSLLLKAIIDERELGNIQTGLMPSVYTPFLQLTSQESVILNDIFRGINTRDIARRLHISEKTVHAHRQRIYLKFNVHSLSELYFYVKKSSLINV